MVDKFDIFYPPHDRYILAYTGVVNVVYYTIDNAQLSGYTSSMKKDKSSSKVALELDSIHRQIVDLASKINSDWNERGLLRSSYPPKEIAKRCPELLRELVIQYYQSTCMGPFMAKNVKKFITEECNEIKNMILSSTAADDNRESLCQDVDNARNIQISEIDRMKRKSILKNVFNIATLLFSAIAALGVIIQLI